MTAPSVLTPLQQEALAGSAASVAALRTAFGPAITGARVSNGQQIVTVTREAAHSVLRWLRDEPLQSFDYLTDITCVEYRDPDLPLEVVYQLRSLTRRVDLRLKIECDPEGPLQVDSVVDLWAGANWLEREVFDMFGVVFTGHPDLRRILMWETYQEGHPLRKAFPLRGRWSRSEQTRQALTMAALDHYSAEELAIADADGVRLPPGSGRRHLAGGGDR